jgi:hypothetical protein
MGCLAWQAFLLTEISPWNAWTFVQWRDRDAFPVEIPPEVAATPATFVTLSNISYSLIAPRFHPQSRWINLSKLGSAASAPDIRRATDFLGQSKQPLRLLFPSLPGMAIDGHPREELRAAVDAMLARHALALEPSDACRLLRSEGLERMAHGEDSTEDAQGFWLCDLRHGSPAPAGSAPPTSPADRVFEAMERRCPKLFRRGEASTVPIPAGAMREYQGADTKLYVLNDGTVMYKYMRSLNPVIVGAADAVAAGRVQINCDQVRGRTVFPWQRDI